ncbi:hypothetical protein [Rubrivirga marina]|uniref:Uncharacterized protein n=1 Tax=Rubrivirga marina TaxID=1196024 RepID=A0A271J2A3_9BACT|nr:hypothetical protein [Rubrivirga marina]PAP77437.1 hypothetical protein BSZ37_13825 [Rubrivirga marina]
MIEAVRQGFAQRAVRSALSARQPRPLPPLADRRVLVVLPNDADGQRATWDLLAGLDVPAHRVRPVLLGSLRTDPPGPFAPDVKILGDDDRDWRRLPTAAVRAKLWTPPPDVALNLADPGDLGAALLAGGSPAAVRIGRHHPDREAFYDLMIQGEPNAASAAGALRRLLARLDPPVLPAR